MQKDAINILLIDDHTIFRSGIVRLLADYSWIHVIGECSSAEEVTELLPSVTADLAILDIGLPKTNGLALVKQLQQTNPHLKLLVLTAYKSPEYFKYVMNHGAHGYIPKDDAFERIIKAIEVIVKGGTYVSPIIQDTIVNSFIGDRQENTAAFPEILTKSENKILTFITKGLSNKEIAMKLKISTRTVETHRSHIHRKLNCKNTAQLILYAIKHQIVAMPD